MPNNNANWGISGPRRVIVFVSSSETTAGIAGGNTFPWIGENAAASRSAIHRSAGASGVSPRTVASVSCTASAGGKGSPAFGGCEDKRSARTTRPTVIAAVMSSNQFFVSVS